MHITNELIHNPGVNEKLEEMDVEFIRGTEHFLQIVLQSMYNKCCCLELQNMCR
jgi:4-hydroxy-3-methylbut-2-enyl diphosphate reductase IspH